MTIENLSLSQLAKEEKLLPELANFALRNLVDTYDEFIKVLYRDIDCIVERIQENPELRN